MSDAGAKKKSKDVSATIKVNINEWIEKAQHDPLRYVERQATEIILVAFGKPPFFGKTYLKGGVLMGIAYGSSRQTGDIDLTTSISAEKIDLAGFSDSFDKILDRTRLELGYLDLALRVQRVRPKPHRDKFATGSFPALDFAVGYAKRDTPNFKRLEQKKSPSVVDVEISFNEPVISWQTLQLGESETTILAYSLYDLIAEKIRAFLQQKIRNRVRRQDIYDLAMLVNVFEFDENELKKVHTVLLKKCMARSIHPKISDIENPDLIERAKRDWNTIKLEIDEELPEFETQYEVVRKFYKSLPWS